MPHRLSRSAVWLGTVLAFTALAVPGASAATAHRNRPARVQT